MTLVLDPPAPAPVTEPAQPEPTAPTLNDPQDVAAWLRSLPSMEPCGLRTSFVDCPLARYLRARAAPGVWAYVGQREYVLSTGATLPRGRPLPQWARLFVQAIDGPPPCLLSARTIRPQEALHLLACALLEAAR